MITTLLLARIQAQSDETFELLYLGTIMIDIELISTIGSWCVA